MQIKNRSGIGLLILVTLIAISGLIFAGSVGFFSNAMRQTQLRIDQTKAYYLAQAGVMRAIYDWRVSNSTVTSRRYAESTTTIAGTNSLYKVALDSNGSRKEADFVYYDKDAAVWVTTGNGRKRFRAVLYRNIHTSNPGAESVTFAKAKVSWWPNNGCRLRAIFFNGTALAANGTYTNGQVIPAANTLTLASGSTYSGTSTYFEWRGILNDGEAFNPPDPITVTVQYTFSDDAATSDSTSHEIKLWDGCQLAANCDGLGTPLGQQLANVFTITSTGQVNQTVGGFEVLKTVKAVVSGTPATPEIHRWQEIDTNAA